MDEDYVGDVLYDDGDKSCKYTIRYHMTRFIPFQGSLMLHRSEPAMKHQERVQTLCDVSMHYFGSNLQLDYEKLDPTDEIIVEQQHCGGNTLLVFKERILPHSEWSGHFFGFNSLAPGRFEPNFR